MSIHVIPGRSRAIATAMTCRISAGPGSTVSITSDASTSAAVPRTQRAPAARTSASRSGRRSVAAT
jgi:hypothetical protein